jgi:CubicO group peptidase (beta-lactamase class C family)
MALLIAALWWLWYAGPVTVWRIVTFDDSTIEDHLRFPGRALRAGANPFRFAEADGGYALPQTVAVDGAVPAPLDRFLSDTGTVAFLAIRHDTIVDERYGQGYDAATPTLAFSMSKSFLSLLIGAALDEGVLADLESPVTDRVPELAAAGFDRVTLEHLLQMTSGMDYLEIEGSPVSRHTRFYYTDRLERELLRLTLGQEPGQGFAYKSGENALLGLVLARALAPETITAFAQRRLWEPLGMEHDGGWSLDRPDGLEKTWCCLSATARDYAKLGRLVLNDGVWGGERLLPPGWIERSTAVDTRNGSAPDYQYQWWLVSEERGDVIAMGHLGQFLYLDPQSDTILVRLGTGRGGLGWEAWQGALADIAAGIGP